MRRKKPRAGDVWLDRNEHVAETITLLRIQEGVIGRSPIAWELLVTRHDGTTYIDWENIDSVYEWYTNPEIESGLRRVV